MLAPIAPDGKPLGPLVVRFRGEGAAKCEGILLMKGVADDAANVIFAENGGIKAMGHYGSRTLNR
jgi:hypothetical protein